MYIDSLMVLARPWSSPHDGEVIRADTVSSLVGVAINGWGFFQVLFISFSRGSGFLSYVLLIACKIPTLIPVDGPTLSL